ncbi:MAG TPA: CBS domain-containing protein [Chloroflexota bacterium]|nr:CBS domain-containing protein [Chloroflexota bacterium]
MEVSALMSRPVITVRPDTSVAEVARTLLDHQISGVPVIEADGRIAGMVTESDLVVQNANVHFPTFLQILDARIYLTSPYRFEEELRRALGTTAQDVMTRHVWSVRPEDDISNAATLMVDHGINQIPVIADGKLVGIVARSDIIRHILEQYAS